MQKYLLRIAYALLTFVVGVAAAKLISVHQDPLGIKDSKVSVTSTPVPLSCEQPPDLPTPIKAALDNKFPGWQFPSTSNDICRFLKEYIAPDARPELITGDFDGDSRPDNAVLIEYGTVANNGGVITPNVYVVALMNRVTGLELQVLDRESVDDYLVAIGKGRRGYNYESNQYFTYSYDAIFAGIFEKAGTSYVYEKGAFRAIITSD